MESDVQRALRLYHESVKPVSPDQLVITVPRSVADNLARTLTMLLAVAEAARDAAIQMHCMCRPHKICEKCDLLKELEKLEGEW